MENLMEMVGNVVVEELLLRYIINCISMVIICSILLN